ncbi:hypothetical protein HanIR_Chr04g0180931 [Helianthus annuus]|nr:hypothetical protein HanIR_Chr04g0180931 [Helianthus annuus]
MPYLLFPSERSLTTMIVGDTEERHHRHRSSVRDRIASTSTPQSELHHHLTIALFEHVTTTK